MIHSKTIKGFGGTYYAKRYYKKYNGYTFVKKGGSLVRNNFAADPTKALDSFGSIGKIIDLMFNKIFQKLIHKSLFLVSGFAVKTQCFWDCCKYCKIVHLVQ